MNSPFSAVLMAGGGSCRMGSDKAGLSLGGQPLWRRQVEVLQAAGAAEVMISGDPDPNGPFAGSDFLVLPDETSGAGPLGGLIMALRRARHSFLMVLAVDMPAMTSDGLRGIFSQVKIGRGCVPQGEGRFFEPLAAVYPREVLELAETRQRAGALALQGFVASAVAEGLVVAAEISPDELGLYLNVNTPEAWAAFASSGNSY